MDWLGSIASWLQLLTSIPFFYTTWKWGATLLAGHRIIHIVTLALFGGLFAVSALSLIDRAGWLPHRGPEIVSGRHFDNETVVLDNRSFFHCTFENVKFRYGGGALFFDPDTRFIGRQSIDITNNQASAVIQFMVSSGMLTKQPESGFHLIPPPH